MSNDNLDALLAAGDPAFLDVLDVEIDPARLVQQAGRWYAREGTGPRTLLFDYLRQPLNPFHEPLVIALFELARQAGDDLVMAVFPWLSDRSLRRESRGGARVLRPAPYPRGEAIGNAFLVEVRGCLRVLRLTREQQLDFRARRFFGARSRLNLRRQAWHYFEHLGRAHPERYVEAATRALMLYTEEDARSPMEVLFDDWCLGHLLFHHSPALRCAGGGQSWRKREGWPVVYSPAPAHERLWSAAPQALLHLQEQAPCDCVRRWAGRLLARQGQALLAQLPVGELFALLSSNRSASAHTAEEILSAHQGLEKVSAEEWVSLLVARGSDASSLIGVCRRHLPRERVTAEQAVRLASSSSSAARFAWDHHVVYHLRRGEVPVDLLLCLLSSPQRELRSLMAVRVADELKRRSTFEHGCLLAFLEHHDRDVRAIGWSWFRGEDRLREDVGLWRRLAVSQHADVRDWLLDLLDEQQCGWPFVLRDGRPLDGDALRVLWARVLLTLAGRWPTAHRLARQLVSRLEARPEDHVPLLAVLGEVLRRSSGPAWREALAGLVRLVQEQPDWQPLLAEVVPELQLAPLASGRA